MTSSNSANNPSPQQANMSAVSKRLLVCTDLDRTLIPNGRQPESPGARERFKEIIIRGKAVLVYVTGRDKSLVLDAVKTFQLPAPDLIVSDVGSSIYTVIDDQWCRLVEWDTKMSRHWPPDTTAEVKKRLSAQGLLFLQEPEKQKRFKVSYYAPLDVKDEVLMRMVEQALGNASIPYRAIWSIDPEIGTRLLDILPANAGKLAAIQFIMDFLGFSFQNTIFAGDSGNDLDVLVSPVRSILVANADNETRRMALENSVDSGTLYFARGSAEANGNYAAGIVEGLLHYYPELNRIES